MTSVPIAVSSPGHPVDAGARAAMRLGPRGSLAWVLGLTFVATLPDAMIPPVLEELFVDRYGVSPAAAHWFMAVNLIGAVLMLPALAVLRRRWSPAGLLAGAAFINAGLLAVLAMPIGFGQSLLVRLVEGGADLMVLAVLFDLVAKSGSAKERGRRFGLAGMILLLAIACGLLLGGVAGGGEPTRVFWLGAAACGAVGVLALVGRRVVISVIRSCPVVDLLDGRAGPYRIVWPAASMTFADRMLAGIMTATVPLYLAGLGWSQEHIGALLGLQLLPMALGAYPAGRLADRLGHRRVRAMAAASYGAGLLALVAAAGAQWSVAWLVPIVALSGIAGAALMPTAFAIGNAGGRGAVGMGQLHAAGNCGYFCGIAGAGLLMATLPTISALPALAPAPVNDAASVIAVFAAAYLLLNAAALAAQHVAQCRAVGSMPAGASATDAPG